MQLASDLHAWAWVFMCVFMLALIVVLLVSCFLVYWYQEADAMYFTALHITQKVIQAQSDSKLFKCCKGFKLTAIARISNGKHLHRKWSFQAFIKVVVTVVEDVPCTAAITCKYWSKACLHYANLEPDKRDFLFPLRFVVIGWVALKKMLNSFHLITYFKELIQF